MPLGDVETFYQDGAWHNRVEGSGTSALSFSTQAEAVEVGRAEARENRGEHTVRSIDGRVEERTLYGSDTGAKTA
jgi:hypothetical protein